MYGPLTKSRVVRWLLHFENGSTWQAVLRSADENEGGTVVVSLVLGILIYFCCELMKQRDQAGETFACSI